MKFSRMFLAVLMLPASCMAPVRIDPPTQPPNAAPDQIQVVAELVNEHRRKIGCKPLAWVSPIAKVAENHSRDMAAQQFFSHTNLLGETPFVRLEKAGIRFTRAAENIASGQTSGRHVMQSWLQSAGHRRNIEDCRFIQHGIGLFQNHWTHLFVTPR